MVTITERKQQLTNGSASSADWMKGRVGPILFTDDLSRFATGAHFQISDPQRVLTAADYPLLAAIWDNEDDAVYDSL